MYTARCSNKCCPFTSDFFQGDDRTWNTIMNMSAPSRTICELMNNPSSKPIPRDIVFGTEKVIVELNRNDKQSSNKYDLDNKDVAPIAAFRRCSLDEHMKRLKSAGSRNAISNTTKLLQKPPPAPPKSPIFTKGVVFFNIRFRQYQKEKESCISQTCQYYNHRVPRREVHPSCMALFRRARQH